MDFQLIPPMLSKLKKGDMTLTYSQTYTKNLQPKPFYFAFEITNCGSKRLP